MRKEFIVERQGRAFCLYAGLLDMAHQSGLREIITELVQVPSASNAETAIVSAVVVLETDGVQKRFTGYGDAAPNNVAPAMRTCLLRMAETRAKARALRDATNIAVAAFEELGEEDAHDGAPEAGYPGRRPARPASRETGPATPAKTATNPDAPATAAQMQAIRALCDKQKRDAERFVLSDLGVELEKLSQAQAADIIRRLSAQSRAA